MSYTFKQPSKFIYTRMDNEPHSEFYFINPMDEEAYLVFSFDKDFSKEFKNYYQDLEYTLPVHTFTTNDGFQFGCHMINFLSTSNVLRFADKNADTYVVSINFEWGSNVIEQMFDALIGSEDDNKCVYDCLHKLLGA